MICGISLEGDGLMIIIVGKSYRSSCAEDFEMIMFSVVFGMEWLHSHYIICRNLKASNVVVNICKSGHFQCFVANYKCSIGVLGTGFF
jgi:hypothetical protein